MASRPRRGSNGRSACAGSWAGRTFTAGSYASRHGSTITRRTRRCATNWRTSSLGRPAAARTERNGAPGPSGSEPTRAPRRNRPPALASERPDTRCYTALECPGCGLRLVRQRVLHGLYCKACGPRRGMLVRAGQGARAAMTAWVTGRTIEESRAEIAEIG